MKSFSEKVRDKTNIRTIGSNVPGKSFLLLPSLGQWVFLLFGWRLKNELPNIPKFVIIVGPHTSNWDFVFGISAVFALKVKLSFLAKHTLFRKPFGTIIRRIGGIPIDRRISVQMVDVIIRQFNSQNQFILAIAPEGTRKKVDRWRTGFYHMAMGANVPIFMVGFDYKHKAIQLGPLLYPTGNINEDIKNMQSIFNEIKGKRN